MKNILVLFIFLVLSYLILQVLDLKFTIPESESVNGRLFLLQEKNIKNDFVVFSYEKKEYKTYKKGKKFIKKIGCDSGDILTIKDSQVYCNNRLIATSFFKNKEGELLPQFDFNGIVPDNSFFALGEHPKSFDSRYFGLVDKKDILFTARRIF